MFYLEVRKIVFELSLLPLLIWSTVVYMLVFFQSSQGSGGMVNTMAMPMMNDVDRRVDFQGPGYEKSE